MPTFDEPVGEALPPEAVKRITEHMNDDHADAVLRYVRVFGGEPEAQAASLKTLDSRAMQIETTFPDASTRVVAVPFPEPLPNAEAAHHVMVKMAKEARRMETRLRAIETAKWFAAEFRTVLLATTSSGGAPDVSVAPAVWFAEEAAFYIYVSELSTHTENLQETQRASLMLIEDESEAAQLLARRRLTFPVSAAFVAREADDFRGPMEALKAKFGAVMEYLETMTDFHLVRLVPGGGRLVNGFGQAFDVEGADWTQIRPARVKGHGHQTAKGGAS